MRPALPLCLLLLSLLLAPACTSTRPAANRLDRTGERRGRWSYFYDEARTRPQALGRYRHGRPVGRWRYYAPEGYLQRREQYQRDGYSRLRLYYPGGQLRLSGQARTELGPRAHFYWLGEWRRYSEAGRLDSVLTYEQGHVVARRAAQ